MNYWFSSDWHLNHKCLQEKIRSEFSDIHDMNHKILTKMFGVTTRGDQFYFLGDLILGNKEILDTVFQKIKEYRLHFHLIIGNHDIKNLSKQHLERFASVSKLKDIKIDGQKITLCHFPMISWNASHYGAWQLFGHHHRQNYAGSTPIVGKQINVNCEFHDYKPWNFEEVQEEMKKLKNNWDFIKK